MGLPNSVNQNPTVVNPTVTTGGTNIADELFRQGKLTAEQVKLLKFEAINSPKSLETLIVEKGFILQDELIRFKAGLFNVEFVDLYSINIPSEIIQKISKEIAEKNMAIAIEDVGGVIKVAMSDPTDLQKVKFLQTMLGAPIRPVFASPEAIQQTLDTKYGAQVGAEVAEALEEVEDVVSIKTSDSTDISQISNAPVSRIVSMILEYGVKYKASDIHIEPREGKLSIRFRINGVMSEKLSLPRKLIPPIVSRIKILADLKIDEHRIPQDGRFQIKVDDKFIDLRVSVMPAIYGEKVVMRLLEKGGGVLSIEKTGLRGAAYKTYIEALKKTQGIILITGPTGSGKTQTLASSVAILNKPDVNIMTLEDPVEIRVDGINQVQINAEVGLTFSKGLRAFLRQDPDVIMVGEIRDKETAELAIQAALTGHLVLSTLHTNSAAGALPRLLDMGIQPYLLASTINVVVGQRLVRTINDKCREAYIAPDEVIAQIQQQMTSVAGYDIYKIVGDQDKVELFRPAETPECKDRGYSGRLGIFEVFTVSDIIGKMVMAKKSEREIHKQAVAEGMITMVQDGFMKALEGYTTVEEVLRVQS